MDLAVALVDNLLPGLVTQPLSMVELVAALIFVMLLRRRAAGLAAAGRIWTAAARRAGRVSLAVAGLLLLLHAAAENWTVRRAPGVHDEFAYLLSAATFLEGRATNPTPAESRSLETVHVNLKPTYNAMYPPGQGLALAAAWRLTGNPLYANWAGAAALAWIAWWSLRGWLPARWALAGACIVGLRFGVFGYWAESYMNGWLPAACGFGYAGALGRWLRRPRVGLAIVAGASLATLFSCRPFETVVLAAATLPVLLKLRWAWPAIAGLAVLAAGVAGVAFHNQRLTGSPFRFGYDVNYRHYGFGVLPGSSLQPEELPPTQHLAAFYDDQRAYFRWGWSPLGFIATRIKALGLLWAFFLGPFLSLGLCAIRAVWRSPKRRVWLWTLAGSLVGLALNPWFFPHYFAASFVWLLLVVLNGFRVLALRQRAAPMLMTAAAVLTVLIRAAAGEAVVPPPRNPHARLAFNTPRGNEARVAMERQLRADGQAAAVFVRYAKDHSPYDDWVYNAPDPARAPVLWLNDLGPETNARVLRAYPARRAYCVELSGARQNLTAGDCP